MAELARQEGKEGRMPEKGRVKNVRDKFGVYEDGAMAHVMQEEEFEHKYGMNRYHRRTVRDDIPVARIVQSAEEEQQQREEMMRLERQKQIADEDERIAREMTEQLKLQANTEHLKRQMTDEEQTLQLLADEDETLRHDEELARQLQEKEKQKFERKRLERERRKIEQQIESERHEAERQLSHYRKEAETRTYENHHNIVTESLQNGASPPDRLLRVDGKVEDMGDFTDFYRIPDNHDAGSKRVMQELQDEELAHLLQEQEHKRGGQLKMDTQKAIEEQDAELARVMHEQEKLRERKRKQKRLSQKQASERQRQNSSGSAEVPGANYNRSRSLGDYSTGGSSTYLHPAHRGSDLNHYTGGSPNGSTGGASTGGSAQFSSRLGDPNQMRDPRDEDLYEQPWTSIPFMQAPPLPSQPPPVRSSAQQDSHHRLQPQDNHHPSYVSQNHPRQLSRDSSNSLDSGAGSPGSPAHADTNMEGHLAYKQVTGSRSNNLFLDLDPTINRPETGHLPDLQLSTQRTPPTAGTPDEQYAEVGDFAPVSGQRRATLPKKGKDKKGQDKKGPGKNKNGSCKQQ